MSIPDEGIGRQTMRQIFVKCRPVSEVWLTAFFCQNFTLCVCGVVCTILSVAVGFPTSEHNMTHVVNVLLIFIIEYSPYVMQARR